MKLDQLRSKGQIPEGAEFIKLLNSLEKAIRPTTCRIKGFNYWPILRFQINSKRKNGEVGDERPLPAVKYQKISKKGRSWRDRWLSITRANEGREWLDEALKVFPHDIFEQIPASEVLYLNRKSQYRKIGNTVLQPFTDGLRWIADKDRNHLTLTRQDPRKDGEQFLVATDILPVIKRALPFRLIRPSTDRDVKARELVLAKVREVNSILERKAPELCLNDYSVLNRLERNAFEIVYHAALLMKVRPKTVFLSSYTGANYVCAAARYLGIKVVDLQHGGMYPSHPLAANWSDPPSNGYELLPDVFWCWSEDTALWISSTIPNCHRTIVGGNPKTVVEDSLQDPNSAPKLPARSVDDRPRVLVALQYGKNQLIPAHVKEAYEATKDTISWHFRLHPAGRERLAEAVQVLDICADGILEISDCTVRQSMAPMDILLTDASTIVYEAIDMGLRTAVWSDVGADYFSQLVEEKSLGAVRSKEEIIDFFSEHSQVRPDRDTSGRNKIDPRELIAKAFDSLMT